LAVTSDVDIQGLLSSTRPDDPRNPLTDQLVGYYSSVSAITTKIHPTPLGDVAIHVRGSGPSLVLLHANPGSSRDFDAVVATLSENYRVLSIDWPGYGASTLSDPTSFHGAMSYRDVLPEILHALDNEYSWGPFVLVGSSVGGFAAITAAQHHPELIAGLVLVAPGGFTSHNVISSLACRTLGRETVARHAVQPLAWLYLRRRNAVTRNSLREAREVSRDGTGRAVFSAVWRSFIEPGHDLRDTVKPKAPVLVTWGRWDPVLPVWTDGRTASSWLQVPVHRFASGHEPYAETPDEWLAVVQPFLASLRDASHSWRSH